MRRHMNGTEDDGNSYKVLRKHEKVTCDLCDRTFKNRFESIVHNASHIIIPLIKQGCLYCDICNSFVNSQDDLNTHKLINHREVFINKIEPISNESPETENIIEISDSEENSSDITIPIRDRLQFEDDDTNFNGILKDLVTECKVTVPICNLWDVSDKCFEPSDDISNGIPKPEVHVESEKKQRLIESLVLEDPLPDIVEHFVENDSKQNSESNCFSALVRPGIFRCRYCLASFPNRFSLIQHEVVHIKISKGRPLLCLYCDKYIAGNNNNLNKHINKYHWESKSIPTKTEICKKCGLKYRKYHRHLRNYHAESTPPTDEVKRMKLLKCCDLCISFLRHRNNLKYIIKGTTKDELGVRYPCEFCGKLYFELKIVQRHTTTMIYHDKEIKRKTNEDRLKQIRNRFKMLKIRNK